MLEVHQLYQGLLYILIYSHNPSFLACIWYRIFFNCLIWHSLQYTGADCHSGSTDRYLPRLKSTDNIWLQVQHLVSRYACSSPSGVQSTDNLSAASVSTIRSTSLDICICIQTPYSTDIFRIVSISNPVTTMARTNSTRNNKKQRLDDFRLLPSFSIL